MNTLKKTVAVVLAVAMVLTMGIATSFAAYSDVQSTASYADAVNILSNLGVFTGYEDGTFRPNNTITRAEVAAIIVRVLDLDEQKGATSFTDVPADHWAAGYINTAYAKGVINGMGDGTFAPGADVTYEQVVKMIVAALGYEPKAATKGGYPTGYLAIASEESITSGAVGTVGQPATRATVAKLVYNALDVDMMEQTSFGTDTVYETVEGKTLLSGLDIEKVDVVVTSSYLTKAMKDGTYDADDRKVTLEAAKKLTYDDVDYKEGDSIGDFEEGGTAAASLLGKACEAYVGVDDDTDEDTIYAITAKGTKNSVTTVKSNLLAYSTYEDGDDEDVNDVSGSDLSTSEFNKANKDGGSVYFWRNGREDKKPASLTPDSDGVRVFVNYEEVTNGSADKNINGLYYESIVRGNGGVLEFIDNDGNGDFDVVIVSQYTGEGVIDTIEESDGVWMFEAKDDGTAPEEYDPEDDDVLKLFVKGENYIDVSEIAEGDTITIIGDENDDVVIVYNVSSDKVEGKCPSVNEDNETASIGGNDYYVSPSYDKALRDIRNTEGTYYLNSDGLISLVDTSAVTAGDYAFIVGLDEDTSFSTQTFSIKLVDAKGVTHTYDLKSKVRVYKEDYNGSSEYQNGKSVDDDVAYEILGSLLGGAPGQRIIKYSVENEKLAKVYVAADYKDIDYDSYDDKEYDGDDMTVGGSDSFSDSTIVFATDGATEDDFNDDDNISVGTPAKFFSDGDNYTVYTYVESDTVVCVLAIDPSTDVDMSQDVFVVSNATVTQNEDDEDMIEISGIQGGKSRSFVLFDGDDSSVVDEYLDANDACTLAKGSVILVGNEANGYVDTVEVLVLASKSSNALQSLVLDDDNNGLQKDNKKDVYSGWATLEDYDSSKIYLSDGVTTDGERDGYEPKSGTNIVVVDYTSSRISAATVKTGTKSSFNLSSKYEGAVFYRMYDIDDTDKLDLISNRSQVQDLVLYKFNEGELVDYINDLNAPTGTTEAVEDDEEVEVVPVEEITPVEEAEEAEEVVEPVEEADDFDGVIFEL